MSTLRPILLVDDSPRDLELAMNALSLCKLKNDIVPLRDGVEALDWLNQRGEYAQRESGPPAVILLDLKMPRMDGLEVLREMRDAPRLKYVPVVIMTSSREEQDLIRSYQLGVNAYIVKPVDFAEFVEAVRQAGLFWAVLNETPPTALG